MTSSVSLFLYIALTYFSLTNPLEKYRWEKRVVLFYSDNSSLESKQLEFLKAGVKGFEDRELVTFRLYEDKAIDPSGSLLSKKDHQWLLKNYIAPSGNFHFVLIGKDGGIKLKSTEPVDNKRLFELIDSMPMRIQEMKKGQ